METEIERALRIARLWRAGKMIGGDEDDVRDALLGEVERLHSRCFELRNALRDLIEANDDYINGDVGFPFADALEKAKAFLGGAAHQSTGDT